MRAPITLARSNCKAGADFSSLAASNVTLYPESQNTIVSNGHISLAACPDVPICPPASKPPSSPTCAPRLSARPNFVSGERTTDSLLIFLHSPVPGPRQDRQKSLNIRYEENKGPSSLYSLRCLRFLALRAIGAISVSRGSIYLKGTASLPLAP